MVLVQPVRATLPRRREVRARVGVLEDVRGAAGDGLGSALGDERAWERFIRCSSQRGRVVRARGRVGYEAATWLIEKKTFSSRRTILQTRMKAWTALKRPYACGETYTPGRLKLNGEEHGETLRAANNYASTLCHSTALRRSQVTAAQNDARGATRSRRG